MTDALTLLELNSQIGATIAQDTSLRDVWVTAETSDVRVSGGHCYLELVQKDEETGRPVARLRAIIWASLYGRISAEFLNATGQRLVSDIKVMVKVTVNFHPAFGLSAVITAINPEFTCGDLIRRRRMMLQQLTEEGIIDMNRTLALPEVPARVAVISAKGAAGYGDFITHLYNNPSRLRFSTTLFPTVMQGENAPSSIIEALERVAEQSDDFDCVVIIRGGGATGDLASFDNYDLAANVAQFPIPVIVGIGHERDVTILDYVAAVRVKTPTAAAEWLIGRMTQAMDKVRNMAQEIFRAATSRVSGGLQQLAYYQGILPTLAFGKVEQKRVQISSAIVDGLLRAAETLVREHRSRLDNAAQLIAALSPEAVLRRGYAVCRMNGKAITDASQLKAGDVVETRLANGIFKSNVTK